MRSNPDWSPKYLRIFYLLPIPMKKIFSLILALGILVPLSSFAFKTDAGENLNLTTPINGDYYIAGGNVNLGTNVNGDVCTAGGKIFINGDIKEDLLLAGGELFINGNIGESARIMWGKIVIDSTIQKDLLLAGGEITLSEKTNIQWETKIAGGKIDFAGIANNVDLNAGEIYIKGTIEGNAIIRAEKINFEPTAKILGDLYYESSRQNTWFEQIVQGKVTFKQVKYHHGEYLEFFSGFAGARFAFLFIFGLILLLVGQKRIRPSLETLKKYPRESLGIGFLTYIALPVAAFLLAITIIGMPFAFVTIAAFITIMIFAKLLNVYFYTNLLIQKRGGYDKLNNRKKIWILLGCTILSAILSGIDMIFAFFALGAIIRTHILKKK